jgi:hypothetical protein
MTDYALGRRVNHDPRSRAFGIAPVLVASETALVTKTWTKYGPVLDQGSVGSCTGNAMAHALNCKGLHRKGTKLLNEDDALKLYSMATARDPWPGEYPPADTGSSGLAVCKAAQELGYIRGYRHAFSTGEALGALMLSPIIVGTNWYESMFEPDEDGFVKAEGQIVGGHEYCITGVNVRREYVTAVNSWGRGWGLKGKFRISFELFDRLLNEEGDATIPLPAFTTQLD